MLALTTSVLFYENFAKEALFTYARHQFLKDDRLLRLATRIVEIGTTHLVWYALNKTGLVVCPW